MKARTEFFGPATVREIGQPSRARYGATSSTRLKVGPIEGDARERVSALHVIRMLEQRVGRVISTERCAQRGNRDAGRLALGVDERKNLVRHIGVVLRLHPAPVEGVRSLVLE